MEVFRLFQFFMTLLIPGLIGAMAFSITARFKTEMNPFVALILNLLTFTTMITGLYYLKDVTTVSMIMFEFGCLSFTRKYILLSTLISVAYGVGIGLIRRLFFWIRR